MIKKRSYTINKPVPEVFSLLADIERYREWTWTVWKREKLTDGPIGIGTRFRAEDGVGERSVEYNVEIVEFELNRRLAIECSASMPSWNCLFTEFEGGTKVEFEVLIGMMTRRSTSQAQRNGPNAFGAVCMRIWVPHERCEACTA